MNDSPGSGLNNPEFYTYILVKGGIIHKVIRRFSSGQRRRVTRKDLKEFTKSCLYIGKGIRGRKTHHLKQAEKASYDEIGLVENKQKILGILYTWAQGLGLAILQIGNDTNHFEACSKEFSVIKAIGLNHLTNKINAACYRDIKSKWSGIEVVNYGRMLLHNTLISCISDKPNVYYKGDIFTTFNQG